MDAQGARRRGWMLILLTLVGVCSSTDRAIISTVLEPVKHEFGLTDSQLGLVAGLAFAVGYTVVVVPAGVLADRVNRRRLISGALAVWSLITGLCGFAATYPQLVLNRLGVGAGEAGGHAAIISSVGDLYPPERRATSLSIYYLSAPAAVLLAGAVGGWVTAAYGWRAAMFVAAAPGLLLSVALLISRDIPRVETAPAAAASFRESMRFLIRQHALLHVIAGVGLVTAIVSGQMSFAYAFFMREHHMSLKTLGPLMGFGSAAAMAVATLASGPVSDRLARRDPSLRLWVIVAVLLVASPGVIVGVLSPLPLAFPLFLLSSVVMGAWPGPAWATAQNLAPPQMRSTISGVLLIVNGLLGVGFGPLVTGRISDAYGLPTALIVTTALGLWAALHFALATRTLRGDLARAATPPPSAA